jgi:TonB family protein
MTTLLSVLILGLAFLQQSAVENIKWVPQRIEDLTYPRLANYAVIQGSVTVKVEIDETGMVQAASVVHGHPLLAEVALENIKKWRFRKNETTTDTARSDSTTVTYVFRLEGLTPDTPVQSFVFEYPGTVTVTSEAMCADHVPCKRDPSFRPRPEQN